jgi:hypothetical protein
MANNREDKNSRISEADAGKSVTHSRPEPKTEPPSERPPSQSDGSSSSDTSSESNGE